MDKSSPVNILQSVFLMMLNGGISKLSRFARVALSALNAERWE
jgi:hypothetical protein